MGRRLAEPLLWLALAMSVVWGLVFADALGAEQEFTSRPIAAHITPESGVLAVALFGSAQLALVGLRRVSFARWAAAVAGVAMAAAAHGFSRISEIELELQPYYVWGSVAAGGLLVLAALAPGWWSAPAERRAPGVAGTGVGVLLSALAFFSALVTIDYDQWGWIGVHEETQPSWDYGVPWILLLVGLVAATLHGWARRWWAAALAVVLGFGALSLGTWATMVAV